jgi:hypothetical protein
VAELAELDVEAGWDRDRWSAALDAYFDEHDAIGTDAPARRAELFAVEPQGRRWAVRQTLDDPAGHHDWVLLAEVDLDASDASGDAVVHLVDVTRWGAQGA